MDVIHIIAYFAAVFTLWLIGCLIMGIGIGPSNRVYPRDYKIRTWEDRQHLFRKLRIKYTPSLVFSKPCCRLRNVDKSALHDYHKYQRYYDKYHQKYAPYVAFDYIAPIYIRWVSNRVGYGLFADKDIRQDAFIMKYGGEVLEHSHDSTWSWSYPSREGFGDAMDCFSLAANRCGNEARFSNHGDKPNVRIELVYHNRVWHLVVHCHYGYQRGRGIVGSLWTCLLDQSLEDVAAAAS